VGFREPSTIKLTFDEGDDLHGLEVHMRGMSIADFMQSSGMDGGDGDDAAATVERFYQHIVSWNLDDPTTGQPVPVADAPNRDSRMIRRLNNAWIETVQGVHKADPLPDSSTSGEPSQAPVIPMAPLSESQAS
jgi:hypothetical protein